MKTKNLYRAGITALTLALVLAGCSNLTGPGINPGATIPSGMGLARIRLNAEENVQNVRTALPDLGTYFTLTFTASGKTTVEEVLDGETDITVALEPATWTLTVNGYANSAQTDLKVTGSTSVNISAGTVSSFEVYLTPDFSADGTGILAYNIDFPDTVDWAFLTLYPLDGTTGTSQEIDLSSSANNTQSLSKGSYQAVIDLYDDTDANNPKAVTWTGVVHIYSDLTTELYRTFEVTDFADCGLVTGTTLSDKLDTALASSTDSTIVLDSETDLSAFVPKTLVVYDKNITITIRGNGNTVQLGSSGSLFTLSTSFGTGNLTLVLQDVTLKGVSNNTAPLVRVNSRGTLVMKTGSSITGNTNFSTSGGGVYVSSGGTFNMSGGMVSNNTVSSAQGGGVYVDSDGTFNMSGGAVSNNTASSSSYASYGGGVSVYSGGTFNMSGGTVSNNTTSTSSSSYAPYGGGVSVSGGTFLMSGGEVRDNTASSSYSSSYGGGVYVSGGTFLMSNGTVSGNTASVSSSSSSSYGGGVYISSGTFTMSGGEVSGNTASSSYSSYGGGVSVSSSGTFTKQPGAIIYGLNENDSALKNTAGSDGDAVYVDSSPAKKRYTTAGTDITLDSSQSGSAGGWEEPFISDITYSYVSGGTWTLQSDGRRKSPVISHDSTTKERVSFTSIGANASITIQLDVSSESGYDYAFISTLDNPNATYNSGVYTDSISGGTSSSPVTVTVTIPVPTAGSHFIEIGYRKDYSVNGGSDCAWFKVIE
jgi:hypothetical protein